MLSKFGYSFIAIAGGIFAEFILYEFWPSFIAIWGIGLSEISNTAQHAMIRSFATWLPLPLLIVVIPGIVIGTIVWVWRQP